jgi:PAS domain S-box-containing protein
MAGWRRFCGGSHRFAVAKFASMSYGARQAAGWDSIMTTSINLAVEGGEIGTRAAPGEGQGTASSDYCGTEAILYPGLFTGLAQVSRDAVCSWNTAGIVTSLNAEAERMFGYTADEVVGQPFLKFVAPEHQEKISAAMADLKGGNWHARCKAVALHKDGSTVPIELTFAAIQDFSGRILGVASLCREDRPRRRSAGALARRVGELTALFQFAERLQSKIGLPEVYEAALSAILNALGCDKASLLLLDKAGAMRFVASRGLSEEYRAAVDGHSPWTPDTARPQPICISDIRETQQPAWLKQAIEDEGIRALGFVPLEVDGKLIGKFMTYYKTPHDFTDAEISLSLTLAQQVGVGIARKQDDEARRVAEDELRRNEERLRLATQTGKVGIWEWDVLSNRVTWTESLYAIHGIEKPQFSGDAEGFMALVHPDDLQRVANSVASALNEGKPYELEFRALRPDGRAVWLFTSAIVLREGGRPARMIGATLDITEQKRAADTERTLTREVQHRSHNLLSVVQAIAQRSLSGDSTLSEARTKFLARLHALARAHHRLMVSHWSGIYLGDLVSAELEPFSARARICGPQVLLEPNHAQSFSLALHELATNAVKHGALSVPQGEIFVDWTLQKTGEAHELVFRWREQGGPTVVLSPRQGFGTTLLTSMLGRASLEYPPEGMHCEITVLLKTPQ